MAGTAAVIVENCGGSLSRRRRLYRSISCFSVLSESSGEECRSWVQNVCVMRERDGGGGWGTGGGDDNDDDDGAGGTGGGDR